MTKYKNPKLHFTMTVLTAFALMLFLFIFYSCKKTEINYSTPLHDADFVTKFFETKTTPTAEVAAIIKKLKAENDRTGFVNKLPAKCGLPVWDKIVIQKQAAAQQLNYRGVAHGPSVNFATTDESGTKIIIPLTITNDDLSSLIIAQPSADTLSINCRTTNGNLYYETHIAPIDSALARNDLVLFFYMENITFGNTTFYRIPAKLFPEITNLDGYGTKTVTIAPVDISNTTLSNSICVTLTNTQNINGVSVCGDTGPVTNLWVPPHCYDEEGNITDCNYDPPPSGGGSGGGAGGGVGTGGGSGGTGGGGGGTGGGGGGNPTGGGGGGGGNGCPWYNPTCTQPPPPPVQLNPCQVVDSFIKIPNNITFVNALQTGANTEHHEMAILIVDPLATNSAFDAITGPDGQLKVDFNPPIPVGAVWHNHYNDPSRLGIFTMEDLQKLYQLSLDNKIKNYKTFTFGLVTDQSAYTLMLDSATFKNFGDTWLSDSTSLSSFSTLFYDFYKITPSNTVPDNELRFLKLRNAADIGIKLFRGNATLTQFTPITLNSAGDTVITDPNCSLLSYNQ